MKTLFKLALVASCSFLLVGRPAEAAVAAKVVSETVEFVSKKFAKETAEEGLESLTTKITKFADQFGDDGIEALRKVGPGAMKIAGESGAQSTTAIRAISRFGDDGVQWIAKRPAGLELAAKYGDDAAEVLVKHKEIAEPIIREGGEAAVQVLKTANVQEARLMAQIAEGAATKGLMKNPKAVAEVVRAGGEPAVRALGKVGVQDARLMSQIAEDATTKSLMQNPKVLDVIAKYGDNAVNYIWRNKGKLAVAAGLTAFLANPQPFIEGARDLSIAAVNPLSEGAREAARSVNWTLIVLVTVLIVAGIAAWQLLLLQRGRPAPMTLAQAEAAKHGGDGHRAESHRTGDRSADSHGAGDRDAGRGSAGHDSGRDRPGRPPAK